MKIKLTKEQRKHLESIRWLYMGARGSGRTTLLAYVLIETVLMTGQNMKIVDHHSNYNSDMNLAHIIDSLIKENKLPLEISKTGLVLKTKQH